MRHAFVALALFAAACGQTTAPAETASVPEDARAGSSGAANVAAPPFALEAEALVGQWSFARDCGLYDLVFAAGDGVDYYDYTTTEGMAISYRGSWSTLDNNRVALSVRLVDASNAPTGPTLGYTLDVKSPVTDDLIADFGRDGAAPTAITARRCEMEDRE